MTNGRRGLENEYKWTYLNESNIAYEHACVSTFNTGTVVKRIPSVQCTCRGIYVILRNYTRQKVMKNVL